MPAPGPTVFNDRYELHRQIARGGMADVYLARDLLLDRPVAVKVLFDEFSGDTSFVERFRREARAAAAMNHPNIVQVFSVEEAEGTHFITMQLVRGKTLTELLLKSGFPLSKFFDIAIPFADAIAAAHPQGRTPGSATDKPPL